MEWLHAVSIVGASLSESHIDHDNGPRAAGIIVSTLYLSIYLAIYLSIYLSMYMYH